MLLFKKKDLLVVISKSDTTVQFTKPLKDILKYQHRYNYKFKMYETGKVTVADDYIIEGETLTVLFGSASVTYNSEGATYTEGGSGGGSGGSGDFQFIIDPEYYDVENPSNNVYIYDTQNQRWNLFIPQAFLCVLPDNYDSSKFTFIGSVSGDGYNVYYMPVHIHLTTEATETAASETAGAYIKSENPIYGYTDGQGNSFCFVPTDAVIEYGTPK